MLTVADIVSLPELSLRLVAGETGAGREVRWLHVSELRDPTPWLEGGELLLTTGLAVGANDEERRAYVRLLAGHGLAGLGFGLGFGFEDVPPAIVAEADRLGFPIVAVPYEVPFIALTKVAFAHLASTALQRMTEALAVHERLAQAVIEGRGLQSLLGILSERLGCSLALVDEGGRVLSERHYGKRQSFERALELPVLAQGAQATLRAKLPSGSFSEHDLLVLHHGQTALAFELSRRRAVSAAELRLAGDLIEDLEHDRLDDRTVARRIAAFGLEPEGRYAALLAVPGSGSSGERLRLEVARDLDGRGLAYLSTARRTTTAFLIEADDEARVLELAGRIAQAETGARFGVGRPASGRMLGRSLVEARAALDSGAGPVSSYRDLGSLELLLGLPEAALEAFVDRVLGQAARNEGLVGSLAALLESGCRWSEAADRLGVHRHTLRYRMDRLREQTGRHPDAAADRMELWLAVKALQALEARGARGEAIQARP